MEKGESDSFRVTASNLVSTTEYTIRLETSTSDIAVGDDCSDSPDVITVDSGSTSYRDSFTLHACEESSETVTAYLYRGSTYIASAFRQVTVTVPPTIAITNLDTSMEKGESDSFTVTASNLLSGTYTIRVTTDNSDIGFNSTCSEQEKVKTVSSNSASFTLTLHACDAVGGTVEASLRRDRTSIVTASIKVTVTAPPAIRIVNLRTGLTSGESDPFHVIADNLVAGTTYTIQVTTDNTDIGFNEDCSNRGHEDNEDHEFTATTTSRTINRTLYACDEGGGTVEATLSAGGTELDDHTQDIVVFPIITAPTIEPKSPEKTNIRVRFTLPTLEFNYQASLFKDDGTLIPDHDVSLAPNVNPDSSIRPTDPGVYTVGIRACKGSGTSNCGPYVQSKSTVTKLMSPSIDLVPHPNRKVVLSWIGDSTVDGEFELWAAETGATLSKLGDFDNLPFEHSITLDDVVNSKGLADEDQFTFEIRSRPIDGAYITAETVTVTIIDTPIISINGSSDGDAMSGKAVIKWSYDEGATYGIRYRKMADDHTQLDWLPTGAVDSEDWTVEPNLTPPVTPPEAQFTIEGLDGDEQPKLELGELYAVQIYYTRGNTTTFAARESYVWPYHTYPIRGDRVASFPYDNARLETKTFSYNFCWHTFPSGAEESWSQLVTHALAQWELATDNEITIERVADECAGYERFVDEISLILADTVPDLSSLTKGESEAAVSRVLGNFEKYGISVSEVDATEEVALNVSDIRMVDDRKETIDPLKRAMVFDEISIRVGYKLCMPEKTCTKLEYRGTGFILVGDILLYRSEFPDRVMLEESAWSPKGEFNKENVVPNRFNSCAAVSSDSAKAYDSVVHEAGHALGLLYANEASTKNNHPNKELIDSIMNNSSALWGIYDRCSPHPLDIMAIYAIYQTS